MGAALFVRDSRHVTLTQAGRALLPAARRALAAADEARDAVAGVRGVLRGQLHVGAIQTLAVIDLPALLAAFHRAHPHVTIQLSHAAAPVLASAAADAHLDIAFIDGPTDPARLTRTEIGHDDLALAVPQNDPLTKRASIDLADPALRDREFADYRADSALRAQIDVACAAAGTSQAQPLSVIAIVARDQLPAFRGGASSDVAMTSIWWWARIARWTSPPTSSA